MKKSRDIVNEVVKDLFPPGPPVPEVSWGEMLGSVKGSRKTFIPRISGDGETLTRWVASFAKTQLMDRATLFGSIRLYVTDTVPPGTWFFNPPRGQTGCRYGK